MLIAFAVAMAVGVALGVMMGRSRRVDAWLDPWLTATSDEVAKIERARLEWHLPLGSLAPNADLSKLVVWCFAAGFVQTLVPSLLAKVAPREPT